MRPIILCAVVCVLLSAFVCMTTARHKFPFDLWKKVPPNKDCGCTTEPKQQCGCCFKLNEKIFKWKIDDSACINITYIPDEKGAQFTFQWNGKTYLNETLSATNPPPLCSEVPVGLIGMVGVCVKFSNLSWTKEKFGGCIQFQLKLIIKYLYFNLGCYYTKSEQLVARLENSMKELHSPELKDQKSKKVDAIHIDQFNLENFRHRPNGGHVKEKWARPFPEVYKESGGNRVGQFQDQESDGYGVGQFPDEKPKTDEDSTFPDEEKEPEGITP